jgi:curved DNA-binding protein CbpA
LATLGLSDPVDNDKIRQRYRELAMKHHPDRGGDQALLQDINRALQTLLPKKMNAG